jgi:hypothetical protein
MSAIRVVGIEGIDECAPGKLNGLVQGCVGAVMRPRDESERDRAGAELASDDLDRFIGRAVVDDDQFDMAVGLGKDRCQRLLDVGGVVMARQHHAHQWLHIEPAARPLALREPAIVVEPQSRVPAAVATEHAGAEGQPVVVQDAREAPAGDRAGLSDEPGRFAKAATTMADDA